MIFEQIRTGGDRNFAYLVGDEVSGMAALVDPSYDPKGCIRRAEKRGLTVLYVINTHGHCDHTDGNETVQSNTGAEIVANDPAADVPVKDHDTISLGRLQLEILHTPGHTEDGICILAGGKLMTGDTLFVGKVGGTGSRESAMTEYRSLKRLMELPDETEVYPGHDYGVAPSSTIGNEKKTNPFILQPDFEAFLDLKNNWADYKRKHGIK